MWASSSTRISCRPPLQRGVDVELAQDAVDVDGGLARQYLEALEQGLRLLAPVRLDHADDDVHALLQLGARRLQHLVGLADAGRRADEDLEAADAPFPSRRASASRASGEGRCSSSR